MAGEWAISLWVVPPHVLLTAFVYRNAQGSNAQVSEGQESMASRGRIHVRMR